MEFYKPEWIIRGTTWKWILTIFKYKNEYYKQSRKSRWKNEVICLVFKFPSWVLVLNLSRKVHFLQFCADFSKKPKSVKEIYIFHPKVLTTFFQKIIWFIGTWSTLYEILAIKICWLSRNVTKLFDKWQLDKWPHFFIYFLRSSCL